MVGKIEEEICIRGIKEDVGKMTGATVCVKDKNRLYLVKVRHGGTLAKDFVKKHINWELSPKEILKSYLDFQMGGCSDLSYQCHLRASREREVAVLHNIYDPKKSVGYNINLATENIEYMVGGINNTFEILGDYICGYSDYEYILDYQKRKVLK